MKANREMKRLFVGGLGQNISKADLHNQFSRFGEVSDVDIIIRKDNEGNPQKVFAYVNIRVAEADLKKCMSVLNKTKWKGGTLQIQLAKESFLHRLAQEREEVKAEKDQATSGSTGCPGKMGAMGFRARAVPGTEIPGHRNWVVGKFGRVLPILHLKNQHKRKIIKYDPSKYCHNLKKIGEDFTNVIPISSLTWELEGGNDPKSKKRRGEFSDFHNPPKKTVKEQKGEVPTVSQAAIPRSQRIIGSPCSAQQQAAQKTSCDPVSPSEPPLFIPGSESQRPKNVFFQTSGLETTRKRNRMSADDTDSEDELQQMIEREENLEKTTWSLVNESENDPFDTVKNDFKSDVHKLHSLRGLGIKHSVSCLSSKSAIVGNDHDYDSGDTDEIIAMKRNAGEANSNTGFSQMENSTCKKTLKNKKHHELSSHHIKVQKRSSNVELAINPGVKPFNCESPSNYSRCENVNSMLGLAGTERDEYDAMMKNCLHVTLTLADWEHLAGSDLEARKERAEHHGQKTSSKNRGPSKSHRTPVGFHPEEIVASLLEREENTHGKQKPEGNKFQAFKGIGCLYGKESVKDSLGESAASANMSKDQNSLKAENPSSMSTEEKGSLYVNDSASKPSPFRCARKADDPNHAWPQNRQATFENQDHKAVSPSSLEKGNRNLFSGLSPLKDKKSLNLGAETHRISFDKEGCHETMNTEPSEYRPDMNSHEAPGKSPAVSSWRGTSVKGSPGISAKEMHAGDNLKRLAAIAARQKAKEAQKKLVHKALANLDSSAEDNKPVHIIFGSSSESETEETPTQDQCHLREELAKESVSKASGKLFDSSDDEESVSEDDTNRFTIKPHFEGRAGQKLMDLQSHFGTDDRFRMDSRFLESDSEEEQEEVNEEKTAEEEELAAEKLRALSVVQSVLHINLSNSTSRGSVAAKKFKDIIHYDPTRHDHVTYERSDEKSKESKAKRKKKREEAEKLPEVSKEMYYNIATDLKEIFQHAKDTDEKEDGLPQDEACGGEKAKAAHSPAALVTGAERPGMFMFSFFESDTKAVNEETYRAETVKPVKIVWQGAPHFHDSSSEEEDVTEETNDRKPSPGEISLPEKETTRFFFFSKNDERLHGSGLFWRGVGSSISRNSWEARTNNLRMDCRRKHKDAKRRVKPK
ncbi:nucleolar protein 8 isoform X2 [Manis pentadactyla]|uniref:nucleolar protein 8 isoform X2 n=1 Tax=Manis pentadactyla TaxID=143292 RepID=UPI00255C7F2C|nr:nucleolar protein 8 isoform X2 [Manis pentadactyla]